MAMKHLLWKDARTIQPLIIALVFGIVLINVIVLMVMLMDRNQSASPFVSLWILMPNLLALGAPALLVGTEEETGTLGWLRTLPVSWRKVADAKLVVAGLSLLIVWVVATLVLFLVRVRFSNPLEMANLSFFRMSENTAYTDQILSVSGIAYLMFFSCLLLLCGFITAYLFRSALAALIAVVPLIACVSVSIGAIGRLVVVGDLFDRGTPVEPTLGQLYLLAVIGVGLLVVLWTVQRWLASRRLAEPRTNVISNALESTPSRSAYRPPISVVGSGRPPLWRALLWQQFRQVGLPAIGLSLLIAGCQFFAGQRSVDSSIMLLLIALFSCWLGGLTFYGDNVKRRSLFFADRGYSPHFIWWTRLLFPGVCCLALIAFGYFLEPLTYLASTMGVVVGVSFAMGQLASQWRAERPVLVFFLAPLYSIAMIAVPLIFVGRYEAGWSYVAMIPVLLFASWRLTNRWITRSGGFDYSWRSVGYSALAIALPVVLVLGQRYASVPDVMTDWRESTRASYQAMMSSPPSTGIPVHQRIDASSFQRLGYSHVLASLSDGEVREVLDAELKSDRIGQHISLDDLSEILSARKRKSYEVKTQSIATQVLLKWSTEVRELAVRGEVELSLLEDSAELSEYFAVQWLQDYRGPSKFELVDRIPSQKLRRDSRRGALLRDWFHYQQSEWKQVAPRYWSKKFRNYPVGDGHLWLSFERERADRFVDEWAKLMLAQIDNLPENQQAPEFRKRLALWVQISGRSAGYWNRTHLLHPTWTQDYERMVERVTKSTNRRPAK